jgi:protein-disulfide isomerase
MHQALMASQDISIDGVRAVATGLGLDVAKLEADMASPETEKVLAQDMELARKLGLRGTPAFVVDGQDLVPGAVPLGQLKALVEQARKRG